MTIACHHTSLNSGIHVLNNYLLLAHFNPVITIFESCSATVAVCSLAISQ